MMIAMGKKSLYILTETFRLGVANEKKLAIMGTDYKMVSYAIFTNKAICIWRDGGKNGDNGAP